MNRRAQGRVDRTAGRPPGGAQAGLTARRLRTLRPANDNAAPLSQRLGLWGVLLLLALIAGLAAGALLA